MLKRTRSQSRLFASNSNSNDNSSSNTKYRSKPTLDDSESDSDSKENIPSPPSTTPSKRLRGSPPTTPKNVRYITKELQRTKVIVSPPTITATKITKSIEKKIDNKKREQNSNKEEDIYQRAKAIFRRTAAPSRLIGRSQERERMIQFWTNHVLFNKPGCLYVSGSPGTGKTAMLTEIIRNFQSTVEELDTHQVKEVMINCMSIREPKGIYSKLVNELKTSKQTIQTDIVKQAEQILNGKKNVLNVVILDEIDHLITRDQDVLYKIFEWASSPASRLVLIGIANALDLTDRLLPRLRTKNCEPQLLNFNPYKVPEISAIIKDRLYSLEEEQDTSASKETRPLPLMQPNAVELCARKVAASMGDLRTALDVCRRAIELAETDYKRKNQQLQQQQQKPVLGEQKNAVQQQQQIKNPEIVKVSIPHVMKVLQSVFGSPAVQKLKQLNLQQKIVMGVLMVMARNSKKEQITLGKFRESYTTLCAKSSMITPVSGTELVDLLSNIETAGILTVGKSKEDRSRRIHLSVQDSEIVQMIQEVSVLNSWMSNIVSSQAK